MRVYNCLAAALVRLIVAYCTARKRYVDYVHTVRVLWHPYREQRTYMRRYVIFGYRTGDPQQTGVRKYLPNLYLHHMHAPDADTCLHDHPWPWGLSFVLLGGYVEERTRPYLTSPSGLPEAVDPHLLYEAFDNDPPRHTWHVQRTHTAPAFNYIPGNAFHRVAGFVPAGPGGSVSGRWDTFTLFLAGPRRKNKPWGYLVPGRGYVDQKTRHLELEATEVRP